MHSICTSEAHQDRTRNTIIVTNTGTTSGEQNGQMVQQLNHSTQTQ